MLGKKRLAEICLVRVPSYSSVGCNRQASAAAAAAAADFFSLLFRTHDVECVRGASRAGQCRMRKAGWPGRPEPRTRRQRRGDPMRRTATFPRWHCPELALVHGPSERRERLELMFRRGKQDQQGQDIGLLGSERPRIPSPLPRRKSERTQHTSQPAASMLACLLPAPVD